MTVLLVQAQAHVELVLLGMEITLAHVHNVLRELINQVPIVLVVELELILQLEQPVVPVNNFYLTTINPFLACGNGCSVCSDLTTCGTCLAGYGISGGSCSACGTGTRSENAGDACTACGTGQYPDTTSSCACKLLYYPFETNFFQLAEMDVAYVLT